MTCRPDVSHAYSRLGQHQANPTESAMDGLQHCFRCLIGSKHWGLSGPMHKPDEDLSEPLFADLGGAVNDQYGWEFFVDTDFAGNAEVQNKRRSQVGILALLDSVPVYWKSSVMQSYANEDFDEDHPDRSSGASETRGAGDATMDFLHLSYIAREAGIKFPKPSKHIDCGQECVRILRDKAICRPTWVGTLDNVADIFIKMLSVESVRIMRGRIMVERPS